MAAAKNTCRRGWLYIARDGWMNGVGKYNKRNVNYGLAKLIEYHAMMMGWSVRDGVAPGIPEFKKILCEWSETGYEDNEMTNNYLPPIIWEQRNTLVKFVCA